LPKVARKPVEASPGPRNKSSRPDTRYRKSLIGAVMHSLSSTQDDTMSAHTSQGSLPSSSPNLALLSVAAAASCQSGNSEASDSTPSCLSQRKILFSKSKPFVGLKANREDSMAEEDTLYTIRRVPEKDVGEWVGRKRARDVYSLVNSDEMDSIEDD